MGYEIHLVKAGDWASPENRFSEAEWSAFLAGRAAPEWLYFANGDISVKNPSGAQIQEFVRQAKQHGWTVQGDDGETYGEDGYAVATIPSIRSRFRAKLLQLAHLLKKQQAVGDVRSHPTSPFRVGDKVHTTYRKGGVVIEVDPKGNHGCGCIRVRFPDGVVLSGMFVGHDFEE